MPIIDCCNKQFDIPYNSNTTDSEYIKDVVKTFGSDNITIPVPDRYCSVINNYVEYISNNKVPITNRQHLLLCFHLNTLFIDDGYFKYLVQQVFNNWSYMCTMVYSDFNDDLQWLFFSYSPYNFIPKHLLDNDVFMKRWNDINQNVITMRHVTVTSKN